MDLHRWLTPQPAPKNIYKNLDTFFLLPTLDCLLGREDPPRAEKRKRGGHELLNLISFELGALGGKLTLIPYHF
jgi:hypothetical protein